MREIRTSGSMSGDGKRSVATWPKLPRPSSTLPSRLSKDVRIHGEYWNVTGLTTDIANSALMTRTRLV